MIFGLTDSQRDAIAASRSVPGYKISWVPWFAWRPVRLMDGRWAWWQRVFFTCYRRPEIPASSHFAFSHGGPFGVPVVYSLSPQPQDAQKP